jgi:hypothetical protein
MSRHRKRHASEEHHHYENTSSITSQEDKKGKQEMQYLAHIARHEVARGGLDCPEDAQNFKKPRLSDDSIDMSRVTMVHSKDYFAPPRKPGFESAWNVPQMMNPDLGMSTLLSIIKSCSEHYRGQDVFQTASFPSTTSPIAATSTMTQDKAEIDNSDVASSTSSVTEGDSDDVVSGEESTKAAISMGQALSLSKQPRYAVL